MRCICWPNLTKPNYPIELYTIAKPYTPGELETHILDFGAPSNPNKKSILGNLESEYFGQ